MSRPDHLPVSIGRTGELSALLFGTTELAHVVADALGEAADGLTIDLVIDLRRQAGVSSSAASERPR